MKKILSGGLVLVFLFLMLTGCNYSLDVGFVSTYHYENAEDYTMGEAVLSGDIREINVSWIGGSVTVDYHDGDTLLVSEACKKELGEENSLYYRVVGDTLTIQYAKSGVWTTIDFDKDLTISLPRGTTEDGTSVTYELSFTTVSADVNVLDIQTKKCEFENVSGKITATLLGNVDSLQIETVSGNASVFVSDLTAFDIESVSGNVSLMGGNIRSGDVETVSGDFSLALPPNQGYTLDFDSVSGDVDLYGAEVSKVGDRYTVGDGAHRYDVETVSGNVTISEYKV